MLLFFVCCIVASYLGRKLGWTLSRHLFYATPSAIAVPLCLLWGVAIAYGFRRMVTGLHPNIILAIIGFMAGGYISIPDYGMGDVWQYGYGSATRHDIVSNFPFLTYIIASIVFYFVVK
jgi:hypothetical protein